MIFEEFIRKHIGKKFHGPSSCFLFVRQIYQEVLGIEIRNDYVEMLGEFRSVDDPKPLDLVVMRTLPTAPFVTNHIGVYLRGGSFMHCARSIQFDETSPTEVKISACRDHEYGRTIAGYLRHKSR